MPHRKPPSLAAAGWTFTRCSNSIRMMTIAGLRTYAHTKIHSLTLTSTVQTCSCTHPVTSTHFSCGSWLDIFAQKQRFFFYHFLMSICRALRRRFMQDSFEEVRQSQRLVNCVLLVCYNKHHLLGDSLWERYYPLHPLFALAHELHSYTLASNTHEYTQVHSRNTNTACKHTA